MYKFLDTTNHVRKIKMQMVNYWTCPDTVQLAIVRALYYN